MGKKTMGIYQTASGWEIDKFLQGIRLRQSFQNYSDAEAWLTRQLESLRQMRVHGHQPKVTFGEAAGRFLLE